MLHEYNARARLLNGTLRLSISPHAPDTALLLPRRFSLSTFLLAILAVAVAMGVVQWRRLQLIEEIRELSAIGDATFPIAEGTHRLPTFYSIERSGGWWPSVNTKPNVINVKIDDFGKAVVVGGKKYSLDAAKRTVAQLRRRLAALGVTDVAIYVDGAIYNYEAAEQLKAAE